MSNNEVLKSVKEKYIDKTIIEKITQKQFIIYQIMVSDADRIICFLESIEDKNDKEIFAINIIEKYYDLIT